MWTNPGFEPLPSRALRVRRIRSGLAVAAAIVVLAAIDTTVRLAFDIDPPAPPMVIPAVAGIALIAGWWQWTLLSWRAWGWRLDEATFQTRSGVYTKVWKGVPRDRVQFVEVTAGPLQRSATLATLVVRTAGVRTPAVHVEDLDTGVAEHLRSRLSPRPDHSNADEPPADEPIPDDLGTDEPMVDDLTADERGTGPVA
jgi:membrane protein YdbS with pleckstrin-like domain